MNSHALTVLEFPRVLAAVAERSGSSLAAERLRARRPETDREAIEAELRRVAAMRALMTGEGGWNVEPVPDIRGALGRLHVVGAPWTAQELLGALILLRSSRRTRAALGDEKHATVAAAVLRPFVERLHVTQSTEANIERAIADDGSVRDEASPVLRRLRRDLRAAHGELIRILERALAKLDPSHAVADMSVTVREGRYVIPIRREARVEIGGIVHGASATGATLFVEPPAAVEFGNRIREMEAEELREIDRILTELTAALHPLHAELESSLDALVELDTLHARARWAVELRCHSVELCGASDGADVRQGKHPLLLLQGIEVVPFDLRLDPAERTMLISGPNTGGKTVLLKALGLLSALTQAGIPVPVDAGTRIPVFDDIFADVGDEQSIEASLSTFSAHLKNLAEILRLATSESLVLIDELGSGTDPLEGAALGGAILADLTSRGTLTIATTHLGGLKELATEVAGVVNSSLQFDAERLAPSYRLIKGIPGRSYGIEIARRLGLPAAIIGGAEERLPRGERDVAVLLADLERREAALSDREREVAVMLEDARARAHGIVERERRVRERERELEREARKEARRYLLDARAQVEQAIADVRSQGARELEDAAREARRTMERLAADEASAIERLEDASGEPRIAGRSGTMAAGDTVAVGALGGRSGRLVEVRGEEGVVAVGSLKLTVPLATLERIDGERAGAQVTVALRGDMPDEHAPSEIDVRGMRVDEVDSAVMHALDAAVRSDLRELRIIHGKGTGTLRSRVAEMLQKDVRVRSFRLGMWNEGGTGVTLAELA